MLTQQFIENQLRNYALNAITSRIVPYDHTVFYTYGKNINIDGINFGELQSWYITLEIPKNFDILDFADKLKTRVESYEREVLAQFPDVDGHDVLCCELCDWCWLEGENGSILRESITKPDTYEIILVKYAKCFSKKEIEKIKAENISYVTTRKYDKPKRV